MDKAHDYSFQAMFISTASFCSSDSLVTFHGGHMLRTREGSDLPRVAQTQHLSPKLIVVQWTEHGAGAPWYISVSSY